MLRKLCKKCNVLAEMRCLSGWSRQTNQMHLSDTAANNLLVFFSLSAERCNSLRITILVTCIFFSFFFFLSPRSSICFINSSCVTLLTYKSNYNFSLSISGWEINGKALKRQILDKTNQLAFTPGKLKLHWCLNAQFSPQEIFPD